MFRRTGLASLTFLLQLYPRLLIVGFAAFYHHRWDGGFTSANLEVIWRWFAELDCSVARMQYLLKSGARIRQAVKRERLAYLDGLRDQLSRQELRNTRELYQALRKVFPQARSSRRSGYTALSQVQVLDGTFAATEQERQQRWGDFFAEQEAGALISPAQYREGLARQKALAVGRRDGSAVFAGSGFGREVDARCQFQESRRL